MKKCTKCYKNKKIIEFSKKGSRHQERCKSCVNIYYGTYYKQNKSNILSKNERRRKSTIEFIRSIKRENKCEICGETNMICLDFHHKEDFSKDYTIARMASCGKEKILKEIAKCVILCSNCHRKVHFEQKRYRCLWTHESFPNFKR